MTWFNRASTSFWRRYKGRPDGARVFYQAHPNPDVFYEGERYVSVTTGGGGYGDPLDRPADSVRELVRGGYLSAEAARDRFGVVIDAETFEVDDATTSVLCCENRTSADSIWLPTEAGAGHRR